MTCPAIPITELSGAQTGGVEWAMHLPDFAKPEHIVADHERIVEIAQALGADALRITTEAGEVSDRLHGTWSLQPRLGNVVSNRRTIPIVRTIEGDADTFEGRSTDWVIVNTNEAQDRIQEEDFLSHSLLRAFTRPITLETPDIMHNYWTHFLNKALRQGLRELAHTKLSLNPLSVVNIARTTVLTRAALVHSHL